MNIRKRKLGLSIRTWLTLAALFCVAGGVMVVAITPQNFKLSAGDTAGENILAVREVVDEQATAAAQQQARDSVSPVFAIDATITHQQQQAFSQFFAAVKSLRATAAGYLDAATQAYLQNGSKGQAPTYQTALTTEQWQGLVAMAPMTVQQPTVLSWLSIDEQQLNECEGTLASLVEGQLQQGVTEGKAMEALVTINLGINQQTFSENTKALMVSATAHTLRANAFYDAVATELARDKAAADVTPVTIQKGQVVVREGDVINERQLALLSSMGMLAGGIVWGVYIGALLCTLFAVGMLAAFLVNHPKLSRDIRKVLMIAMNIALSVILAAVLQRVEVHLIPFGYVPIILTLTIDRRCGIMAGLLTTLLCATTMLAAGLTALTVLTYFVSGCLSTLVAAELIRRYHSRSAIILVGLVTGVVGGGVQLLMSLLVSANVSQLFNAAGYELISGLGAGILCLGTTPLWEGAFHALTPMKLMELCNPTNALLKRLMFEAPGTYHHSVMVGNLAEAACDAVGANGLLARVGAYYHDVGKLMAPLFFAENQPAGMENPHNAMPPLDSAQLIMRHPHDGAAMLKEKGIAQPIIDIALEHHGSSVINYFFFKAQEQGLEPDKRDYRHTGGRPRTMEAAIVMLADSCEAATRAGGDEAKTIMRKIIHARLDDGQLDRVDITLAQLDTVMNAFDSVLKGAYHGRLQYPDGSTPPKPQAAKS